MAAVEDRFARLKAEAASRGPGWLEGRLAAALGESDSAATGGESTVGRGRRSRPPARFSPDGTRSLPGKLQKSRASAGRPVSGPPAKRLATRNRGGSSTAPPPADTARGTEAQREQAGRAAAGPPARMEAAQRKYEEVRGTQDGRRQSSSPRPRSPRVVQAGQQGRAGRPVARLPVQRTAVRAGGRAGRQPGVGQGGDSDAANRRASSPIADAGGEFSGVDRQAPGHQTAGAGLQWRKNVAATAGRLSEAVGGPKRRDGQDRDHGSGCGRHCPDEVVRPRKANKKSGGGSSARRRREVHSRSSASSDEAAGGPSTIGEELGEYRSEGELSQSDSDGQREEMVAVETGPSAGGLPPRQRGRQQCLVWIVGHSYVCWGARRGFRPTINRTVNDKINNEIRPLLEGALQTAKDLEAAAQILLSVNQSLADMQTRQKNLNTRLVGLKEALLRVLSDQNCENCAEALNIVQGIQLGQIQIPSLGKVSSKLNSFKKINLLGIFEKALQALNNVPKFVNTQTSKSISDVAAALNKSEAEVRSYASTLPINQYIGPINAALLTFEEKTELYGEEVERYEYYRWIVGVVLCCILLLIVACTALGLIFGVLGLYILRNPDSRRRRQRDGAGFLLIQVYLTFIFSWLLILFVFLTFLIGGNIQTLVCKHWVNGDIYKFLDDPKNLPNNINLRKQLGLRENSSFTDMYTQCKSGSPIWDVLQFSNPIDLDSAFNITQYTSDLEEKIDNFTLNLAPLNLMSTIAMKVLQEYNKSGVDEIPFNNILQQIQATLVTLQTAEGFVPLLEALSSIQRNATIRNQLEKETRTLQNILNNDVRDQEAALRSLNNSLSTMASLVPTLKIGIQRTIEDIDMLNGPLVDEFIKMLRNESKCLVNQAKGYFFQYIDWVKITITQDIASCRSVPATLDNARVIVCDNVAHPWNGFWFCLGWCTILLIPNIFLSIKSAQHIAPKSRTSLRL